MGSSTVEFQSSAAENAFHYFIHDYMLRKKYDLSAMTFSMESAAAASPPALDHDGTSTGTTVAIENSDDGFLWEWWVIFADIYFAHMKQRQGEFEASLTPKQLQQLAASTRRHLLQHKLQPQQRNCNTVTPANNYNATGIISPCAPRMGPITTSQGVLSSTMGGSRMMNRGHGPGQQQQRKWGPAQLQRDISLKRLVLLEDHGATSTAAGDGVPSTSPLPSRSATLTATATSNFMNLPVPLDLSPINRRVQETQNHQQIMMNRSTSCYGTDPRSRTPVANIGVARPTKHYGHGSGVGGGPFHSVKRRINLSDHPHLSWTNNNNNTTTTSAADHEVSLRQLMELQQQQLTSMTSSAPAAGGHGFNLPIGIAGDNRHTATSTENTDKKDQIDIASYDNIFNISPKSMQLVIDFTPSTTMTSDTACTFSQQLQQNSKGRCNDGSQLVVDGGYRWPSLSPDSDTDRRTHDFDAIFDNKSHKSLMVASYNSSPQQSWPSSSAPTTPQQLQVPLVVAGSTGCWSSDQQLSTSATSNSASMNSNLAATHLQAHPNTPSTSYNCNNIQNKGCHDQSPDEENDLMMMTTTTTLRNMKNHDEDTVNNNLDVTQKSPNSESRSLGENPMVAMSFDVDVVTDVSESINPASHSKDQPEAEAADAINGSGSETAEAPSSSSKGTVSSGSNTQEKDSFLRRMKQLARSRSNSNSGQSNKSGLTSTSRQKQRKVIHQHEEGGNSNAYAALKAVDAISTEAEANANTEINNRTGSSASAAAASGSESMQMQESETGPAAADVDQLPSSSDRVLVPAAGISGNNNIDSNSNAQSTQEILEGLDPFPEGELQLSEALLGNAQSPDILFAEVGALLGPECADLDQLWSYLIQDNSAVPDFGSFITKDVNVTGPNLPPDAK